MNEINFIYCPIVKPGNIQLAQTLCSQGTNSHLGQVKPQRYISWVSVRFEPGNSQSAVECVLPLDQRAPVNSIKIINYMHVTD